MVLETERLIIAEWFAKDWMDFRPIASDPDVVRYIGNGATWPDQQVRAFVDRQIQEWKTYGFCLWKLVEKNTGRLVGFCGLQHLPGTEEIEIGWWLAKASWGKGLASEAARAVMRYGFQIIGLHRVVAIAQPANHASLRVMEKLAMQYEKDVMRQGIRVVLYSVENPLATRADRTNL